MHLKYAINIIKVMLFMRDPIEKKTVNMSLKMTESLRTHLKEQAAEKGTSFNNFVLSKLEHDENVLTPEMLVHIQNIVNEANAIAQGETEQKRINKMNQEEKSYGSY